VLSRGAEAEASSCFVHEPKCLDDGVVFLTKLDGMSQKTLHPRHRITDADGNFRQVHQSPGPRVVRAGYNGEIEAIPQGVRVGASHIIPVLCRKRSAQWWEGQGQGLVDIRATAGHIRG
jgi:hypothetical protein